MNQQDASGSPSTRCPDEAVGKHAHRKGLTVNPNEAGAWSSVASRRFAASLDPPPSPLPPPPRPASSSSSSSSSLSSSSSSSSSSLSSSSSPLPPDATPAGDLMVWSSGPLAAPAACSPCHSDATSDTIATNSSIVTAASSIASGAISIASGAGSIASGASPAAPAAASSAASSAAAAAGDAVDGRSSASGSPAQGPSSPTGAAAWLDSPSGGRHQQQQHARACAECSQPAVVHCMDCKAQMCEQHYQQTHSPAFMQRHTVVPPERKGDVCPLHFKLPEHYCHDCWSYVCQACLTEDAIHSSHNVQTIAQAAAEERTNVVAHVRDMEAMLADMTSITKQFGHINHALQAKSQHAADNLDAWTASIMSAATRRCEELKKCLQANVESKLAALDRQLSVLSTAMNDVKETIEAAQRVMGKPDMDFLKERRAAINALQAAMTNCMSIDYEPCASSSVELDLPLHVADMLLHSGRVGRELRVAVHGEVHSTSVQLKWTEHRDNDDDEIKQHIRSLSPRSRDSGLASPREQQKVYELGIVKVQPTHVEELKLDLAADGQGVQTETDLVSLTDFIRRHSIQFRGPEHSCKIEELMPGTTYVCRLRAVVGHSANEWSNELAFTTPSQDVSDNIEGVTVVGNSGQAWSECPASNVLRDDETCWRSPTNGALGLGAVCWMVFDLQRAHTVNRVAITNQNDGGQGARVMQLFSGPSADGPWELVLEFATLNVVKEHVFAGFSSTSRYFKLDFLANHGASNRFHCRFVIKRIKFMGFSA